MTSQYDPSMGGGGCGGGCGCNSCQQQAINNAQMNPCSTGPGSPPPARPSSGGGLDGQPVATSNHPALLPNSLPTFPLSQFLRTISDGFNRFSPLKNQPILTARNPTTEPLPTGNNPFTLDKHQTTVPFRGNPGPNRKKAPILPKSSPGCELRCVSTKGGTVGQNYGAAALPHIEYSNLEGGAQRSAIAAQNLELLSQTNLT